MATVTQISVHYSGKKGLPNYGSVGHDVGLTLDLDDGEDAEAAARHWTAVCKALVVEEIKGALSTANGTSTKPTTPDPAKPATWPATGTSAYPADPPVRTGRNSDPEPYREREAVIDPLTQRPAIKPEREGNSTDQAIARGHLIDVPITPKRSPGFGDA
jgi:hypothetical protein